MLRFSLAALVVASLVALSAARADAQSVVQSDWSGATGLASTTNLDSETGILSVSGQWAVGEAGTLRASAVLYRSGGTAFTPMLPAETAAAVTSYASLTTCASPIPDVVPACGVVQHLLHRDTTTGALSLIALSDGSATSGCTGTTRSSFQTAAGVTLLESVAPGEATLNGGAASMVHAVTDGCARGAIFALASTFDATGGVVEETTGTVGYRATLDPAMGVSRDVPFTAGQATFALRGGLLGRLESAVFDLGVRRQLGVLQYDATAVGARIEVYVRTGNSVANVGTRPWGAPLANGASLAAFAREQYMQYRVDVILDDRATNPGGPEPYGELGEIRIGLGSVCDCEFGGGCYGEGELNPANPCESCQTAYSTTRFTALVDDTPCDDLDLCATGKACVSGACVGGTPACDDGLACTLNACDGASGACSFPVAVGCVVDGACVAEGAAMPGNPCMACANGIDPTGYSAANEGATCEDGNFCTAGDTCRDGVCAGGSSPCGDGLSCTDDACDEVNDACTNAVTTGCVIDGTCVASSATNPLDACEVCDPIRPRQWSVAAGCQGCNDDMECSAPGAGVCDPVQHDCVECTSSNTVACGGVEPICDQLARACRGCVVDTECVGPDVARCAADGSCVGCLTDADCGVDAPICEGGSCRGCVADDECVMRDPDTARCDVLGGSCGSCASDADCVAANAGARCVDDAGGDRCGCVGESDCGTGLTCDATLEACVPLATADTDGDGVPDDKDVDDDADGIPDRIEGHSVDFSRDSDEDGAPDWRDPDASGFYDLNGDGTDDRSDDDDDGTPNHLDLDSDGDGIPDSLENLGRDGLDADRDGRLDDDRDDDRDGLVATADADDQDATQTASVLPLRDTDGDGTPDFFDRDSDAEGADDVIEGGGTDADGDGRLDASLDVNGNGLADAVDVSRGGVALALPDTDLDGVWDFQDAEHAGGVRVTGGALCATRGGATTAAPPMGWLLGFLALGLFARRRRRA